MLRSGRDKDSADETKRTVPPSLTRRTALPIFHVRGRRAHLVEAALVGLLEGHARLLHEGVFARQDLIGTHAVTMNAEI